MAQAESLYKSAPQDAWGSTGGMPVSIFFTTIHRARARGCAFMCAGVRGFSARLSCPTAACRLSFCVMFAFSLVSFCPAPCLRSLSRCSTRNTHTQTHTHTHTHTHTMLSGASGCCGHCPRCHAQQGHVFRRRCLSTCAYLCVDTAYTCFDARARKVSPQQRGSKASPSDRLRITMR
jgi:hypothetical protein